MVQINKDNNLTTITLRPNRSINWKELKLWLLLISFPALIIALGWFYVGVWVILPFTGIELGLLTFFMYKVCYQNYRKEIISIDKHQVTYQLGIRKPETTYSFSRPDCYLLVDPAISPSDNLQLALASDSENLAIGSFLNADDKQLARRHLINAGLIECTSNWWKKTKP